MCVCRTLSIAAVADQSWEKASLCQARALPFGIMVRAIDTSTDAFLQKVRNNLTKLLTPTSTRTSLTDIASIQHTENMKELIQIVDICLQDPSRITQVKRLAEQKTATASPGKRKSDDSEPWPAQYTTWGKIPTFWLWQWLAGRYPEFTPKVIEDLNRADKSICRNLLEHETGLRDNTEVDPRCHDKMACAQFLNKLSDERGRRLKGWLAKSFADRQKVNWNAAGCFTPSKVEEGRVTELIWAYDREKVPRERRRGGGGGGASCCFWGRWALPFALRFVGYPWQPAWFKAEVPHLNHRSASW